MAVRFASFNVENLFARPRAMNLETWVEGRPILNAFAEFNSLMWAWTSSSSSRGPWHLDRLPGDGDAPGKPLPGDRRARRIMEPALAAARRISPMKPGIMGTKAIGRVEEIRQ